MKSRKITTKKIQYYEKCKHCKKEIIGTSESQVAFNLGLHIEQKHKKRE